VGDFESDPEFAALAAAEPEQVPGVLEPVSAAEAESQLEPRRDAAAGPETEGDAVEWLEMAADLGLD